jgi:hypothetical protein
MKRLAVIFGMVLGLISASAMALPAQVNLNLTLTNGPNYPIYSIDGDSFGDIGVAASQYAANKTSLDAKGAVEFSLSWLSQGQVVNSLLPWVSGARVTTTVAPATPGLNYLAVRNTSIGNYYGYITLDFQQPLYQAYDGGYTQTLVSYTFDDSGDPITVGTVRVPVPSTIALLGFGLVGIGAFCRKQA